MTCRRAGGDDFEFWEWRIADEALVGEDVVIGRMIDREQADLIEVDGFFHRLHEAEAEQAVFRGLERCARRLSDIRRDRGRRVRWGATQWPTTPGPIMSAMNSIFAAIPGEEDGARAAAAIEFADGLIFFGGEIDFVLRDTGGPEEADDFGIFFVFEAGEDRWARFGRGSRRRRGLPTFDRERRRRVRLLCRWRICCR